MPTIRITVDGKVALTLAQAAERHALGTDAMRKAISRAGLEAVAELDARTPLYLATAVAAAIKTRPGKGANFRKG
jgi:hypothetical protein